MRRTLGRQERTLSIGHEVRGEGRRKVLVLHGWVGDHSIWRPTYPFLDEEAFSYAFMDYRGYGLSRTIAGDHSIAEIAMDAVGLADTLGWGHFSVIGHSMGGMAAQRVALDCGSRVTA